MGFEEKEKSAATKRNVLWGQRDSTTGRVYRYRDSTEADSTPKPDMIFSIPEHCQK